VWLSRRIKIAPGHLGGAWQYFGCWFLVATGLNRLISNLSPEWDKVGFGKLGGREELAGLLVRLRFLDPGKVTVSGLSQTTFRTSLKPVWPRRN
jgi:hypothetical protein